MEGLQDKVRVITAGAGSIGAAWARRWLAAGGKVKGRHKHNLNWGEEQ